MCILCILHHESRVTLLLLSLNDFQASPTLKQKSTLAPSPHHALASALNSIRTELYGKYDTLSRFQLLLRGKDQRMFVIVLSSSIMKKHFPSTVVLFMPSTKEFSIITVLVSWWQKPLTVVYFFSIKVLVWTSQAFLKNKRKSSSFAKVAKN